MDNVDAFLASLDRFSSPTIDAGIQQQQRLQVPIHNPVAATLQGEGSNNDNGAPSPILRRRPRKENTQDGQDQQQLQGEHLSLQPQRQRLNAGGESRGDADIDVDSPEAASQHGPAHMWWCVRCSTENSDYMQSCAICHRRRQRVEGPRATSTVSRSPQPVPQSCATSQHTSARVNRKASESTPGLDPVIAVGPGEVSCPRCTFINPSWRRMCEICEGPLSHPPPPSSVSINETPESSSIGIHTSSASPTTTFGPSETAVAVVPSVALPGLGGKGTTRPASYATSCSPAAPQTLSSFANIATSSGPATMGVKSAGVNGQRLRVLEEAAREALSLSTVPIGKNDDRSSDDVSSDSSSNSSSDSYASDQDSDWDEQQSPQHETSNHHELVRFLETLQSVQFDSLPFAEVPVSMQAHAELRPFQLQALSWLLAREQQQHQQQSLPRGKAFFDGVSNTRSPLAIEENGFNSTTEHKRTDETGLKDWLESPNELDDAPTSSPISKDMLHIVRGGVFADYMGLGKTRTLIALCEASRAPRVDRVTGSLVESTATLIVCPTSLLTQWVDEIKRCVERPASSPLRILVYYGSRKRRHTLFEVAQSYSYVITTYQTLAHEQRPLTLSNTSSSNANDRFGLTPGPQGMNGDSFSASDPFDDTNEFKLDEIEAYDVDRRLQTEVGKLFMIRWARIVLDEAHYIRNIRTRQSRSCLCLSGVCKWVVSATPVQNSLNDLYPLLRFLEVPHFSSLQWWNNEIVRRFNQDPRHPRVVTAFSILFRSILLRRTPDSMVDGKPILDLPPKRMVTHLVALSRDETRFYEGIHTKATEKLNEVRKRDAFTARSPLITFTTAFEMLVRCRQTCLHPYIVVAALRKCHRLSGGATVGNSSGGGNNDVSAGIQSGTNVNGNTCFLHAVGEQQQQQRMAEQQMVRALDQFIQSVVLRRLRTAKATEFVQSLVSEIKHQKLESRECIICLDKVNRPAILPCAHVFCEECIKHALEATRRCPLCKRNSKLSEVLLVPMELLDSTQRPGMSIAASSGAAAGHTKGQRKSKMGGNAEVNLPPAVPADLDLANVANWGLQLSSKTQYLINTITRLPAEDKVVVFSSFLTYLRYAQHFLEDSGITCAVYSGSMTISQKRELLDKFRDVTQPDSPRVLLTTTSSCGVGLNLTCANHCFLMEPSWNPGTEEQALNRIHRIGQTKPVTVTKLIASNTIEQNISQLCERKRALSGYCFSDGGAGGGGDGHLRTADLLALFAPEVEESSEESSEEDESD